MCIRDSTSGDGADAKSLYNKNPLSFKEYKDITATGQDQTKYTEINANVVSTKTGKALSAYLPEKKTIDNCIKTVSYTHLDVYKRQCIQCKTKINTED